MQQSLKHILYENFLIPITRKQMLAFSKHVIEYELRGTHVNALNTALLATHKMYFLPKDGDALFNIMDVDKVRFRTLAHQASSVDTSHHITSDPYNIFTTWMLHRIRLSDLSNRDKETFQLNLLKMLHYKSFTSLVNRRLPYGATEDVMRYTIDKLSGKFYIKQKATPTWKLVIEQRAYDVLGRSSIHNKVISSYSPDAKILYILSDVHTRMYKQVVRIIREYRKNKDEGKGHATTSIAMGEGDEKQLQAVIGSLDSTINKVCSSTLNLNEFIDYEYIDLLVTLTKNIKADILNKVLVSFSKMAVGQQRSGDQSKVMGDGSSLVIYGYNKLITQILQKTYRHCMLDKSISMNSKVQILNKAKAMYSSSRVTDPDILVIKNSVEAFIAANSPSKRSATNASLKITFILYIILLSFKSM